jgi:aminoacyl tRNA synthase complex-interacting multifunctional protein 1
MATSTVDDKSILLVKSAFPNATFEPTSIPSQISSAIFPEASDAEQKEIDQWSTALATTTPEKLAQLNTHLSTRTTILGTKPSIADIIAYTHLAPLVTKWSSEERTGQKGYHHIVRHVDFVQNAAVFNLKIAEADKIKINQDDVVYTIPPIDAKDEKERKKKEKELAAAGAGATAAVAAGAAASKTEKVKEAVKEKLESAKEAVAGVVEGGKKKKEKKEKQPKPQKEAPKEKPLSPALIDLRVGHILKAIQHPNADSLYVSTIAMGDAPGTDNTSEYEGQIVRTVCSGLNGLVPLEDMQNRKIVCVCNLKPVTMRGIKSAAMVLAASPRLAPGEVDDHKGPVELVNPPTDSKAGERVFFEGWEGEPEPVLNPKKKIWESIQPGFTTTEDLEVGFDVGAVEALAKEGKTGVGKLKTKEGLCTVKTLKGATVR